MNQKIRDRIEYLTKVYEYRDPNLTPHAFKDQLRVLVNMAKDLLPKDPLEDKADVLKNRGYKFQFPEAGQSVTGGIPGIITIPYNSSENEIQNILDHYIEENTYNKLRRHII